MRGLFRIIETIHSGTPQYGLCETLGDAYLGLAIMHYVSTVHHVPLHPSHSRKAGRCDRYGVLPSIRSAIMELFCGLGRVVSYHMALFDALL